MDREKLIRQLFMGKVCEELGVDKTMELIKEANEAYNREELRKDLNSNDAKPVIGEVYVFELKDGKMIQISIGLETIEDANIFIETMKEGVYYKSIRPDCVLIAMEVLNLI